MTARVDVVDAARLIRHALDLDRPTAGSGYESLLARYRTDTAFQEMVAAVCDGLSLHVLGTGAGGLIVHGDAEGPFRVTLDNCGLNVRDPEHRYGYALVLAGIAAYGYRDTGGLTETATTVVRCADLEKFLTRAVDRLSGVDDRDDGAEPADNWEELLGVAGRRWKTQPQVHETSPGRLKMGCQRWYTSTALEWLADNQMAVRQHALLDADRGMAYQLTDRFRIGIGELVSTNAFAALADAASFGEDEGVAG